MMYPYELNHFIDYIYIITSVLGTRWMVDPKALS